MIHLSTVHRCVTLGKSCPFSEARFPRLYRGRVTPSSRVAARIEIKMPNALCSQCFRGREHRLAISPFPYFGSGLQTALPLGVFCTLVRVVPGLWSPEQGAEERRTAGHNERIRSPRSNSTLLLFTCLNPWASFLPL